ncbi:hypothetical protein MVEN_00039400 [Mycena venus]|uniref:Uncharacterized protein n=1 Tax=Mycena venus TaxID=2733690 RepID=A0A8H6Z8P5_9AGAR|nr:hypothetical protein MVEN_00039400 [Mycena venus]
MNLLYQHRRRCRTRLSGHSPDHSISINGVFDAPWTLQLRPGSYICPGREMLPAADTSIPPTISLKVGIDLGHTLDALRGITNFTSIFRALLTRPFHSCFAGTDAHFSSFHPLLIPANVRPNMIGRWYLNTMSSGAPACSSMYPLCRLGELFFPADPDEEPFGFRISDLQRPNIYICLVVYPSPHLEL